MTDSVVLTNIYEILHACINEMDEVSEEVLDIILQHLLPASKTDNAIAYKLVSNVVRSCSANIESTFTSFVNSVLVGTSSSNKSSELTEHIYPLLYEIHKISPSLMLKIIPSICIQLQVDEEDIRMKASKLLGLLFASTYGNFGEECPRNFREFLNRFNDKMPSIRSEMVECSLQIMKKKASLRRQIEEALILRMKDNDAEIRFKTIQGIIEIALENPLTLQASSFEELLGRIVDRKVEIRRALMIGLARIYQRFVSSSLPNIKDLDDHSFENLQSLVSADLWLRLKEIPNTILKCWGYPDLPTKHLVIQLVQESLLPKSVRVYRKDEDKDRKDEDEDDKSGQDQDDGSKLESKRASALIFLYHALDTIGRQSLATMMGFKSKIRSDVESYLRARQQMISSQDSDSNLPAVTATYRRSILTLTQHIPLPDNKSNLLENMNNMK
jgi:hypothetical protein